MIDFSQFDSFIAMTMYFNNEAVCRNAVVETRWGIGEEQDIVCPYCGQHHCATRKDGKFRCNHCKRNFTCKVGTIFEDSNLSLVKWFIAMYLISSNKKGIQEKWLNQSDSVICSIPQLDLLNPNSRTDNFNLFLSLWLHPPNPAVCYVLAFSQTYLLSTLSFQDCH